ncbi:hypothetical protein [Nocardia salmonicida]|uniref:hypothetical protein n=1 Tax=Nocardia salmonicida TaxID=53431 RepID=UPI0007A46062|nr:hypothetical protein [Nocardia salmonicida]MBC7299813.1 hypothetical protein [Nocardia sp.]
MAQPANAIKKTSAVLAAAVATFTALSGCGSDQDVRAAAAVSPSTSGTVITENSTDLGSIIVGWGERNSADEITTPKPSDVTAKCSGLGGDELVVDIAAPHGWRITARKPKQTLTVENSDQNLAAAEIDTANRYLAALTSVDWSQPGQVDIAATAPAPTSWKAPSPRSFYLSLHVTC